MFRTIAPVLFGMLITASFAVYDQAGQASAKLPAMLHLLMGGALLVFGRSQRLRSIYAALTVALCASALWFAGGRFGLLPVGAPGVDPFAWAPWIAVAGSAVLTAIAFGEAVCARRIANAKTTPHQQAAAPTRLDVRPASLRLRRPEDRRVIRRQKVLDDNGGGL